MDHFIDTVIDTADHVRSVKRSDKRINISFDEWNVWYVDRYHDEEKLTGLDNWPVAPRLLEDVYSVADAVVFGNLMISLLKHADRVTSASLAQLVNVIAPIMTEPGGPAWRQTTFFPFATTSRLATGSALEVKLESPEYETALYGSVPLIDAVATHDEATGRTAIFLINRSQTDDAAVTIDLEALGGVRLVSAQTLSDADVNAKNTLEQPDRVALADNGSVTVSGGTVSVTLPPVSWTAIELG